MHGAWRSGAMEHAGKVHGAWRSGAMEHAGKVHGASCAGAGELGSEGRDVQACHVVKRWLPMPIVTVGANRETCSVVRDPHFCMLRGQDGSLLHLALGHA